MLLIFLCYRGRCQKPIKDKVAGKLHKYHFLTVQDHPYSDVV